MHTFKERKYTLDKGLVIVFKEADSDDYLHLFKQSLVDNTRPFVLDIIITDKNSRAKTYYQNIFYDDIKKSVIDRFITEFLKSSSYRKNFLVNGDNWEGTLTLPKPIPVKDREVNSKCIRIINKLNMARENSIRFKDFISLKVFGIDKYSKAKVDTLEPLISEENKKLIKDELSKDKNVIPSKDYVSVLRWIARGLKVSLAIRKVRTDAEVRANAIGNI